jgi:hypothetical protein
MWLLNRTLFRCNALGRLLARCRRVRIDATKSTVEGEPAAQGCMVRWSLNGTWQPYIGRMVDGRLVSDLREVHYLKDCASTRPETECTPRLYSMGLSSAAG